MTLQDALRHALALFRSGDLRAAEQVVAQVLEARPDLGDGIALSGLIAYAQGDFVEAEACHRRAIATKPAEPIYRCNLATALIARSRFEDAQRQYERALKMSERFAPAVAGLADVLLRRGDVETALGLLEPWIGTDEEIGYMAVVFAKLLGRTDRTCELIRFVEERRNREDFTPAQRRSMLFALGWVWDGQGETDLAFETFSSANMIEARPFDLTRTEQKFQTLKAAFARDAFECLPSSSSPHETPVFVVSLPRSGSTLVEQIVHAHPRGAGDGESPRLADVLRAMPMMIGSALPYPACLPELGREHLDALAGDYTDRLRNDHPGADRIVDKTIANFERIGIIAKAFPGAKIVHVHREPVETCLSCFMHDLSPRLHPYSTDLGSLGRFYRLYTQVMSFWKSLGIEMIDVEYEALVRAPETEIRCLIEALGLPWDEACLAPHLVDRNVATISATQVREPIHAKAIGRAGRYSEHLGPLRGALEGASVRAAS